MTQVIINNDRYKVTFRGDENPPICTSDSANFLQILRNIIGKPGNIVHPTSDHSGRIEIFSAKDVDKPMLIFPGDAVIVQPAKGTPINVALRTRDCGQIIGRSLKEDGPIFVIHSSNQTEFDFHSDPFFLGPITRRTFDRLRGLGIHPQDCQVYPGPALGGVGGDECGCYEYTEAPNKKDASQLADKIRQCYPGLDLDGTIGRRTDRDKMYFHMGEIMRRILLLIGLLPENIHADYNYCTACTPGWCSDRKQRCEESDPTQRRNNFCWISSTAQS